MDVNRMTYAGFWNGLCKAIMVRDDSKEGKKHRAKWIKDGASEIKLLPTDEAVELFRADLNKYPDRSE